MILDLLKGREKEKKIGLALGSGAARGWAHIGVLRYLNETGIKVDYIAGTSMGALVGASFSLGKLDALEQFALHLDWRQILSFLDVTFPVSGLIEGKKISEFVREHHEETVTLERMPIPFCAVATELNSGTEVCLNTGDLLEAIRASISIPGIFTPVKSEGNLLVDGGLVNPVPVSVVRQMGADFVVAVDLSHYFPKIDDGGHHLAPEEETPGPEEIDTDQSDRTGVLGLVNDLKERASLFKAQSLLRNWTKKEPTLNIFEVTLSSLNVMQAQIARASLALDRPDVLIQPKLNHIGFMEFNRSRETIAEGYLQARIQLKGQG
ncbi:MAG: patatin-like phospholipase family protein [bacterium]|nr:patatin-like phospholipase family protein [bacterium]MDT8366235.1 patatin-like phospholipase family protein [bacterium]